MAGDLEHISSTESIKSDNESKDGFFYRIVDYLMTIRSSIRKSQPWLYVEWNL